MLLLVDELREEVGDRWAGILERQLTLLSGLPQKLDRILTLAAEESETEGSDGRSAAEGTSSGRSTGMVVACLLALTVVVLLTHHLADTVALGGWTERAGALLVLLFGGLLLRVVTRSDSD